MILDLHKLYQYIFGDWANVENRISPLLKKESKENVINNKKDKIRKFFFKSTGEQGAPLISKNDKPMFRSALRALKSAHLEEILFGNSTDQIDSIYTIPSDDHIKTYFVEQDKEFNFFSESKTAADSLNQFIKFFKMSKLIGDFIEKNNDQNNSVAATHAYKMTVVFGNAPTPAYAFQPFDQYLKKYNYYKLNTPLHDALIYPLPKQEEKEFLHLADWRTLIQKKGTNAFQLFNIAYAIERHLKRAPLDYNEAYETAKMISYKNAGQYPQLAELCFQYHLSEKIFNRCLEIEKIRKTKDNLPNITIDGSEIDQPDYYLTKLPIDDPHGYLLGHITNCCQSIGGHSEKCVIDGMTRESNGFYVLLKSQKASEQKQQKPKPINENGKIDYNNFIIVGQGYAWLTQQGNLTFDSWENLTPNRDNPIIIRLLAKFAHHLIFNTQSEILRVTIGLGGKTPEEYKSNQVDSPEPMREGSQYIDSSQQGVIYYNVDKRKLLLTELTKLSHQFINELLGDEQKRYNEKHLRRFEKWLTRDCYSTDYVNNTKKIFAHKDMQIFVKKILDNNELSQARNIPWPYVMKLYELNLLFESKLWKSLLENPYAIDAIMVNIVKLNNIDIKHKEELRQYIINKPALASYYSIIDVFTQLQEMKLDNDKEIVNFILNDIYDPNKIIPAFKVLIELKMINDPIIRKWVFENPRYAQEYINAYVKLKDRKLENNSELCQYIFKNPVYGLEIINNYQDSKLLSDPELRRCVLENPKYSKNINEAVTKLKEINLDKEQDIRKILFSNPIYSPQIANSLAKLAAYKLENNPLFRELIFENLENIEKISQALIALKNANLENDSDFINYIRKKLYKLNNIISAILKLNKVNLDKEHDIRKSLFHNPKHAESIAETFVKLTEMKLADDPKLRPFILNNPLLSEKIVECISFLNYKNVVINDLAIDLMIEMMDTPANAKVIAIQIYNKISTTKPGFFNENQPDISSSNTNDSVPKRQIK